MQYICTWSNICLFMMMTMINNETLCERFEDKSKSRKLIVTHRFGTF